MVDSPNYRQIQVSSTEQSWRGIPVVVQLTTELIGTLSPAAHNGFVYNQLTIFSTANPFEFQKIATCPIVRYEDPYNGFKTSNLCYDKERDILRVVTNCLGLTENISLKELKLEKNLALGCHLTEVPSFIETKSLPMGA